MTDRGRRGWGGGGFGGEGFSQGMGGRFTRLGKRLAISLLVLYVVEQILYQWMDQGWIAALLLAPLGSPGFGLWQVLTHPLALVASDPVSLLFELLTLWFFGATVEESLGKRRFLFLYFGVSLLVALPGQALASMLGGATFFGGLAVGSLALLTAFVALNRSAQLLLFFVAPVRATWLLIAVAGIIALTFLSRSNPSALHQLLAIGLVWVWLGGVSGGGGGGGWLRRLRLRLDAWRLKRRLSRLTVHPGGRGDDDVTYH